MRLRFAVLCAAASLLGLAAAPSLAGAAPHHNRGLTIAAFPNPVYAGEGVVIYGHLTGADNVGKTVVLYHHIAGSHQGYVAIGHATTDPSGYYQFTREENVVETNRSWFVRLAGHPRIHSRTVYERVHALVSLRASSSTGDTRHALTFTGHVNPDHAGERVLLQQQSSGDDWKTIKAGRLNSASDYSIQYRWATSGARVLRVVFPGDRRNIVGASDPVSVLIEQTQNPRFTISTTTPRITFGGSAQITGKLYKTTTTPQADTAVELCHRLLHATSAVCDQTTMTGNDGSYQFVVTPPKNAYYYAETVNTPKRRTASLFIGVQDIITLQVTSDHGTVGQPDTFSGTVTPNKAGDFVLLQYKGSDGDWHTLQVTTVNSSGLYSLTRKFTNAGTKVFRSRILSDSDNEGATSNQVTVTVVSAPANSLAPAH